MEIVPVLTATLAEMAAAYNPRTIAPQDLESLRRSMRFFGVVEPIVVNRRSNRIVGGHQRVKAAQLEGVAELPVVWVDLDDPSEKQLNLALNRIHGEWDEDKLATILDELQRAGADLALTGFHDEEIERLVAQLNATTTGLTDPDAAPELPAVAQAQPGDLIILGKHSVLCGDATSREDVSRLLGGLVPTLMVTDPPYGVAYDPEWRNRAGIANTKTKRVSAVQNDDRADWREAWALFPGDVAYVWHGALHATIVAESLVASGFGIRAQIIWAKSRFAISRGNYHWQHEPCWYAVRQGGTAHWSGDRKQTTLWSLTDLNTPADAATVHSTQKPVAVMRRPIENNTSPGQAVYDPFLGSGTTLIAAEQTGRSCYGMELDPRYVDVIVQRWQAFTGRLAGGWRGND